MRRIDSKGEYKMTAEVSKNRVPLQFCPVGQQLIHTSVVPMNR